MNQPITSTQPVNPVTPIDPNAIIKHGESPTAIILAIAMLLIFIFSGITGLIKVIAQKLL